MASSTATCCPTAANQSRCASAAPLLDEAVAGLREAGQLDDLPRGLLARAHLRRLTGEVAAARRDLDEVREIAGRGGMRLHQTDLALEETRLALSTGDPAAAATALDTARALVAETGYHRRDPDIAGLTQALAARTCPA